MNAILEFFGRCHPVLVHLPIGFLLLALLFQWLARWERYVALRGGVRFTFLLGMISAALSCISGWLLSGSGEYEAATLNLHKWFGISVAVLAAVGYWFAGRKDSVVKLLLSLVILAMVIITGHLGGTLTHGEGFLTKGFTAAADTTTATRKPIANVQEAVVFADLVKPILVNKCAGCHGATKQKGGLRLDEQEWITKGGKNGKVYEPGAADASELYRRITLDPLDEKHMAPKGKPQLTEQEVRIIQWWINSHAGFDKKVKESAQTPQIAAVLTAMQTAEIKPRQPELPSGPVAKVDDAVIDTLRNAGVAILPVAANSNYLLANFVSIPKLDDRTVGLLKQVNKQVAWLKLSYANLSDRSWQLVGDCKNLTRLSIEHTNITDAQLNYFSKLDQLVYLNLVGTKITLKGLQQLAQLKRIEKIYLGETQLKGEDFASLKKLFPNTYIDSGNYKTAFIAADTQLLKPPPR